MTMAEFNIRLFSFNRMSNKQDVLFREVAYYSMIGSHLNPKKVPKTKQKFWKIGADVSIEKERFERMKKVIADEQAKYNNRNK